MGIYSFKMKSSRETLFSESEMEGLEKRFKMMVQNPLMKPKVQTIFSSAEFSMVSAQCESSRLSWETIMPHSPASARRAATFGTDSLSPVYRPRGRVIFTVDEHPIYGSKPVEGKSETLQSPVSLKDSPSVLVQPADTVSGGADPPDAALPQSSGISSSTTYQLKDERKNIETDLKMTPKEISFGNAALQNDGQCPFPAAGLDSGGGETKYTSDALLRSHSIDQLSSKGLTKSLLLPEKKSKGIQESHDIDCDVSPQLSSKDQVDNSVGFISDNGQTRNAVEKMNERGSSPEQGDASSSSSRAKRIDERGTDVRPLISQHHEEPRVIDFSLDGTELKDLNVDDDLVCEQSGSEYSTNDIFDDNEEGSETEEMLKQRRDIYCISCKKPISALDKLFGCHELHDVTTLNNAARLIKVMLNENMMVLKDRVNDIKIWQESLHDQHKAVEKQTLGHKQELMFYFEELMDMLSQWQEAADTALQLGKQEKLESLYARLVPCRLALENARDLLSQVDGLEDISDANTFLQMAMDLNERLKASAEISFSIELTLDILPQLQNVPDFSQEWDLLEGASLLHVPSPPELKPQEPYESTNKSITVYWSMPIAHTVDYYNVFYIPQDSTDNAHEVIVKQRISEDYCIVDDLEANTAYMFWVCAVNRAGESLSSTPALYMTVPSAPELLTSMTSWHDHGATLRWQPTFKTHGLSFTLEVQHLEPYRNIEDSPLWCESESEACEKEISLQHNQTYRLFVRSVNNAGHSDRSNSLTLTTKGTKFVLDMTTASRELLISENDTATEYNIVYMANCDTSCRCLQVLAEVLPPKGHHYWEVDVHKATCYRLGLAGCSFPCTVPLGEDDDSWCLSCTDNVSRIQFLHLGCITTIYLTVLPRRIGILLDYTSQKICFSNADSSQVLYSLCLPHLKVYAPAFGLQGAGSLNICTGLSPPSQILL